MFQPTNSFGSPLACLNRFFRPHVIAQSIPTVRGMRCSKLSKYRFLWAVKRLIRNCIREGFFTCWANVCCWEPAREFPPMTRSCGRALTGQASQSSRGPPRICLRVYPKTRICLFYYFTTFTNSSDINRVLSPTTFLCKKINLKL